VAAFALDNHLPADFMAEKLRADVRDGLTSAPKVLPPKWFYDERGGRLFERITRLPEYYLSRAEREIVQARADEIAGRTAADTLVELGPGNAEKTRLLLTALTETGSLRRYIPVDVSITTLVETGEALMAEYPGVEVHGVMADFESQLALLPKGGSRLTAFLGGTIGTFEPRDRIRFLRGVRSSMDADDWLLLGVDLAKNPDVLVRAYDDPEGVTAEFNRNLLRRINRELRGNFEPDAFDHVALWDPDNEWVEMRLRSRRPQQVKVDAIGLTVHFAAGEEMRTEISAKFRRERIEAELARSGFGVREWWTDGEERFALSLSQAV
jgi:L-histidine Nalpha-methyltransferase